ncbi:MAG: NAD(P)-binding domain-containing protein [Deferribacteres bacterium]|nr:NAD(P)-binding domain-containing protein [candidate division KSB1 bacterium]MCB9504391.1 NAD(P)-binding domain-containing protein [Deferribacteres bacterium]
MKIGILGSGVVGKSLAKGFIKHGYKVMIGSRSPEKLTALQAEIGPELQTGTFSDAAAFGEIVVLAVKGTIAENVLKLARVENLTGKTIIDATNPIAEAAPENGVLKFFTDQNGSLMEQLQRLAPQAHFVKAFSSVGSAFMVDPQFASKPTMFIAGNNDTAKQQTKTILDQFGWETEDMGGAEAARAIEPLCMLWCIPGFRENRWTHAFKLLKL